MSPETIYALALSQSHLSSSLLNRLVHDLGSATAVWQAKDVVFERILPENVKGESQRARLLAAKAQVDPEAIAASYQAMGIQVIPLSDPAYPALLKEIHNPPFILYVRGNLEALGSRTLAVVGTRKYTDYGSRVVSHLVEGLAPYSPCIVSGLAAGIDTLAHQAALAQGLPTVAVFGTGIDQVFPSSNKRLALNILEAGGALVSEYPAGMHGSPFTFPQRNRIIAGLTEGTLVVEGDFKSGALITARAALGENRQVLAVPGNLFNPTAQGPNHLIQQGATMVQRGADIAYALEWAEAPTRQQKAAPKATQVNVDQLAALSPEERDVYEVIGYEATAFDEIHNRNQRYTIMDINTALTMLELNGLVTPLPGARFCRN